MVGLSRLFLVPKSATLRYRYRRQRIYMVIYLAEDFLGGNYQAHDFPYGHLKVHLRKLEQALEKARHSSLIAPGGRCRTEV